MYPVYPLIIQPSSIHHPTIIHPSHPPFPVFIQPTHLSIQLTYPHNHSLPTHPSSQPPAHMPIHEFIQLLHHPVYSPVHLIYPSIHPSFLHVHSIHPSTHSPIHPPVCLIHPSIYTICPSACPSTQPSLLVQLLGHRNEVFIVLEKPCWFPVDGYRCPTDDAGRFWFLCTLANICYRQL